MTGPAVKRRKEGGEPADERDGLCGVVGDEGGGGISAGGPPGSTSGRYRDDVGENEGRDDRDREIGTA